MRNFPQIWISRADTFFNCCFETFHHFEHEIFWPKWIWNSFIYENSKYWYIFSYIKILPYEKFSSNMNFQGWYFFNLLHCNLSSLWARNILTEVNSNWFHIQKCRILIYLFLYEKFFHMGNFLQIWISRADTFLTCFFETCLHFEHEIFWPKWIRNGFIYENAEYWYIFSSTRNFPI